MNIRSLYMVDHTSFYRLVQIGAVDMDALGIAFKQIPETPKRIVIPIMDETVDGKPLDMMAADECEKISDQPFKTIELSSVLVRNTEDYKITTKEVLLHGCRFETARRHPSIFKIFLDLNEVPELTTP